MRIAVDRVGVSLPFVQVSETIAVRILFQDVGVGDGQAELLDPFIRHRRMHLGSLQGCGLSVRADEMFFRNKKPGTPAKGPLRWLPQFLQGIFNLLRFARRRSGPLRGVGLQLSELRLEPNRALEYAKRAHQQDRDTRDQNDALVIFLQPVHQRSVVPRLVLANRSPVIPSEYASPARTEESLTIFCSIELRLRGRTRVITVDRKSTRLN